MSVSKMSLIFVVLAVITVMCHAQGQILGRPEKTDEPKNEGEAVKDQPKETNENAPPRPPPPAPTAPPAAAEPAAEAIKCFAAPHCASGQGCEVEVFRTKLRVCRQKD